MWTLRSGGQVRRSPRAGHGTQFFEAFLGAADDKHVAGVEYGVAGEVGVVEQDGAVGQPDGEFGDVMG